LIGKCSSWSIGSTAKPSTAEIASKTASTTSNKKTVTKRPTSGSRSPVSELVGTSDKVPLPRFNINKLFSLVDALDNDQALSEEKVVDIVNARSREGIEEYRRFLKSGSLVSVLNQSWNATPQLQELAISLRNENIDGAKAILLATPSFGSFARHVSNTLVGTKVNQDSFGRAITTYRTLGEAMLLCAEIEGEGIYSTPNSPDAEHFAPIALQRFRNLDNGDGLVATGEWFESLIRKDGIHPEIARQRLNDARYFQQIWGYWKPVSVIEPNFQQPSPKAFG